MKRLPGITTIFDVDEGIPIPCGHCGDDIRSEIFDTGDREDAHLRWSIAIDIHCHCGAVNKFCCHWTPYLVELDSIEPPEIAPNESLGAAERNRGLTR